MSKLGYCRRPYSPGCRVVALLWLFVFAFLLLPGPAKAAVVILEWTPNPEPDLAGYKVYYGESSRTYSSCVDVGNHTSCAISDEGFQADKTYYFAATAYDQYGNESAFSEEVAYTFSEVDTDGDGISDDDEINQYGSDPDNPDTDGDGLADGEELSYWGEDWNADHDDDGWINLLDEDSDGDGVSDGREYHGGSDPADPDSKAMGISIAVIQLLWDEP